MKSIKESKPPYTEEDIQKFLKEAGWKLSTIQILQGRQIKRYGHALRKLWKEYLSSSPEFKNNQP